MSENSKTAEVFENHQDEADILTDQDQTSKVDPLALDENMGAKTSSLGTLEKEDREFMEGSVDVKRQMDHAFTESVATKEHDIQADFENTPGGLEEVIQKTKQDQKFATARPHRGNATLH